MNTTWTPAKGDIIWHSDGFAFAVHGRWRSASQITLSHDTTPHRYKLEECRPLQFNDLGKPFEIHYERSIVNATPKDDGIVEFSDGIHKARHVKFSLERFEEKRIKDFANAFDGELIVCS